MDEPGVTGAPKGSQGSRPRRRYVFGRRIDELASEAEARRRLAGRIEAPPPTAAEHSALPADSLPYAWLQITNSLRRNRNGHYMDGVSMLVELSIRGLLDVPSVERVRGRAKSGSDVVPSTASSQNAALDGALTRLRSRGEPLEATRAAVFMAPYVAVLSVSATGADDARAGLREAIVGEGPADLRSALLVWLLKMDLGTGDFARRAIFPGRTQVTPRAVRRASPNFYELADHEVAHAVHRVLFAAIPQTGAMGMGAV